MRNKNFFIEQLKQTGKWKIIFSFHSYEAAEHFYNRCVGNNPNGCYRLKSPNLVLLSHNDSQGNE